ncbi:hypothetical protein [Streptomyces sp. NPDC059009]|uniref:hypothetical protein n=1 Tax=Streptomyces sp. NPDC059009 TaxID=3346694 RepID=UPI003678EA95
MRDVFMDELLLITPLHDTAGVRLYGEVIGVHRAPLAVVVAEHSRNADEITVDLTRVEYVSNAILETLVVLARRLVPPQHLCVRATSELGLQERLVAHGWDDIESLQVSAA